MTQIIYLILKLVASLVCRKQADRQQKITVVDVDVIIKAEDSNS